MKRRQRPAARLQFPLPSLVERVALRPVHLPEKALKAKDVDLAASRVARKDERAGAKWERF
jgi:hypothetical protein